MNYYKIVFRTIMVLNIFLICKKQVNMFVLNWYSNKIVLSVCYSGPLSLTDCI